ncbi:YhbY family RNA-binding protein [Acidihalobacter prosperus]
MDLDPQQRRALKAQAHHLKPVIMIGQKGLHDALWEELETALDHHELLKLKIAADRDSADAIVEQLLAQTGATLIQRIGGTATIFRKRPE